MVEDINYYRLKCCIFAEILRLTTSGRREFRQEMGLTFGENRDEVKGSRAKVKEIWIPDQVEDDRRGKIRNDRRGDGSN